MLMGHGFKEVELLGQNVNAWRHDGKDFADLLEAVAGVPGLARLRFATSYPSEFTERMMDVMASRPNIPKALHLPVQAGSNRVLRRMKRFYTREEYLEKAELLRKKMPQLTLSTDVIVGFPGETEADFQDTMTLVREAAFEWMYSFKYSPREGTPAARWEADFVPEAEARERLARLQAMQREIQEEALRREVGRVAPVLVEGPSKRSPAVLTGRSDRGFAVNFEACPPSGGGTAALEGDIVPVRIVRAMPNSLWGETLSPMQAALASGGAAKHATIGLTGPGGPP
jgi:tRNA-2-methylthio-N6-dimethylallyladenosine synthase